LASVAAYKAGKSPKPSVGLETFKLSSNENPFDPLPGVVEAVASAAMRINLYPDPGSKRLVAAIADRHGVSADSVAVGTGSVAVLVQFLQAVAQPGDDVVYAWRSFEAYPIFVRAVGATPVPVPLAEGERHDLKAMARAVGPKTRAVLVCSPNNPTGPAVGDEEFREFLRQVPRDVLVILDEAYAEFVTKPGAVSGDLFMGKDEFSNVAILRSFSKAYGLAGLRVGYGVAHPSVIEAAKKVALTFGVTDLAEEAALASFARDSELQARVNEVVQERERVVAELKIQGWDVPEAQGNFVWLNLGARAEEFALACEEVGLSVRVFPDHGVRITIGTPTANTRFLAVCKQY
jgi:histidinol-phosphate aminotransferase